MPKLMSFAKTVAQLLDGTKIVTRRDGWLDLKPGDVLEAVEWSPRVGALWACEQTMIGCRKPTTEVAGMDDVQWWPHLRATSRDEPLSPFCSACREPLSFRKPRKLGLIRVLSVRRERLGDIGYPDLLKEGFDFDFWTGLDTAQKIEPPTAAFIRLYCAPKPPDPDRVVTRIEFERIAP